MSRKPAIPTTPAEPVYDDWMDYSLRRDLARADALRARQIAEAEAQDAAALAPPAKTPRRRFSGWWILYAATFIPLFWGLAITLIARLF